MSRKSFYRQFHKAEEAIGRETVYYEPNDNPNTRQRQVHFQARIEIQ
jgi:hypothetical protein